MPITTNITIPYPAASDNPNAGVYAGVAQRWDSVVGGPWVDFSGTLTISQPGSIAKTVNYAKYRTWGKHCEFKFKAVMTAAGTGGNEIIISGIGVNNKFTTAIKPSGIVYINAVTDVTSTLMHNSSATNMVVTPSGFSGTADTYTTALAINDEVYGWGRFEAA